MSKTKTISNAKFYTVSAAVYSVLEDLQYGVERFNQFLKWGLDGAREFNFDLLHEIHVTEIEMKPWKQIEFPCDMVDWTKIGFRCGKRIKVFTQSNNISKIYDKDANCVPIDAVECSEVVDFLGTTDYFNSGIGHLYGAIVPHNGAGYFDADWNARVFNFKKTVSNVNMVYLEYITDGINYTGQTVIHPYAFLALQKYIHWQRCEYDDKISQGAAQRAKELYEEKMHDCLVYNLNLSIQDIREALSFGDKQTVKG